MDIRGLAELARDLNKDPRSLIRHLRPIDKRLNGWVLSRVGGKWLVNLTMLKLAERDALKALEGRVGELESMVGDHAARLTVLEHAITSR